MQRQHPVHPTLKLALLFTFALLLGSCRQVDAPDQGLAAQSLPAAAGAVAVPVTDMDTHVETIDGTHVVFQYGQPVPAFDTWRGEEVGRTRVPLDGRWQFAFDPENRGLSSGWFRPDYSDAPWRTVNVPLPWDLYDTPDFAGSDGRRYGKGSAFYDGYAWYRTRFAASPDWKKRFVKLNFLGVNYKAWVYVNGHLVGTHEGGHTPFSLTVSPYLEKGDNVVAVRVYRRPWWSSYTAESPTPITDDSEIPYKPVDYWPYAGITRSVYLEVGGGLSISKILTRADDHRLTAKVVLYNPTPKRQRQLLTFDPGAGTGGEVEQLEVELGPSQVRVATFERAIPGARWWSPDDPQLYKATATLTQGRGHSAVRGKVSDSLSVAYGMRSIAVKQGRLTLNGDPVFLKGVNWHEESAEHGRAMTVAEYDRELGLVLDLNANFIRNSVYNRHPYVYEFADEHGLMVLDDIDTMWLNTAQEKLQTETYGLSKALALMMAWNQFNHPSVIMWSLQNESEIGEDSQIYRNWLEDMRDAVKQIDFQNRPVTWASSSSYDPAFDLADVIGFNEYFGYFYGKDEDLGPTLDAVHAQYPDKPILITENGTWAWPLGNRGPADQVGTEDWQAAKFTAHWQQVVERKDFMAGYTLWVLKDYKQRLTYNRNLNGLSALGLMSFDAQTKRLAYNRFKDAENPVP